jgi:hypothetical protein
MWTPARISSIHRVESRCYREESGMATTVERTTRANGAKSRTLEPAWEVATFFPMQGDWTEADYFALERNSGNWMIELNNGRLEFPPMPDP